MESSVFFIFAVVVVGTSLSFLNLSFLLRSSLVVLVVEVVGSLSAHSPRCRCYFRLLHRSVDRILC